MYHLFLNICPFSFCVCVYGCTHPSLHKGVIKACRVPSIFHTIKHKFTAITLCNKYADTGTQRSVEDILQCTFQHSSELVNTLQF